MTEPSRFPSDFEFDGNHLKILWTDGATGAIPLATLRKNCPCSGCRAEREDALKNPLHVMSVGTQPRSQTIVERAELVGSYALRIVWKDGHGTGIFDFGLLRTLSDVSGAGV